MRLVTGKTFARAKGLMAVLSDLKRFFLFMATPAKNTDVFFDQVLMLGGVGIVAA